MARFLLFMQKYLPRRRRRLWRYVSPRRRGMGMVALALLVLLGYGYWHLTNDWRIGRLARRYLSDLTGARVDIRSAKFKVFAGVELAGVRLYIPGDPSPVPFLQAETVVLKHYPWSLLFSGRIQPQEVICLEPIVTLEHHVAENEYNVQRLFQLALARWREREGGYAGRLPPIRIRQAQLRWVDVDGGLRLPLGMMQLNISMRPREGQEYDVVFENQRAGSPPTVHGRFALDAKKGKIRQISGSASIVGLEGALPRKYRRWRRRYAVTGEVQLRGEPGVGRIELDLKDVSLTLPPEEGGLDLQHVHGRLRLEEGRIALENVNGQIVQGDGARFELSGVYAGHEADSPFELDVRIEDMAVPAPGRLGGRIAELLEGLREDYELSGRLNLLAKLTRDADGQLGLRGTVQPLGMTFRFREFPYQFEDVRGEIAIGPEAISLRDVSARHGSGHFVLDGRLPAGGGKGPLEVALRGEDIPFDLELRDALPEKLRRIWDSIAPEGTTSVQVQVTRPAEGPLSLSGALILAGKAAMTYEQFPYRLENILGQVHVEGDRVRIQVHGSRGAMRCTIDGTIAQLDRTSRQVDLKIRAKHVPLDDHLLQALGGRGKEVLASMRADGSARQVDVTIHQEGGGKLEYHIEGDLENVSIKPLVFPYAVTDLSGAVVIDPERIVLRDLAGRHDQGRVHLSGQIFPDREHIALSLDVQGEGLSLDAALFEALPESVKNVWRSLQPTGQADVAVKLRRGLADQPRLLDYDIAVTPRGASVRWEAFPYPFDGVTGLVVARPGLVELKGLTASQGAMRTAVSGDIRTEDDRTDVSVSVQAENMPIDQQLLDVMPSELAWLGEEFSPGGSMGIDLRSLHIRWIPQPPPEEGSGAEEPGAPRAFWQAEGTIRLDEAVMPLASGQTQLTGAFLGSAGRDQDGVRIAGSLDIERMILGRRELTDVQGRLSKSASGSLVKISALAGKVHGGQFAGQAEVRLRPTREYGVRLSVEGVRLEELFAKGDGGASQAGTVRGLLAGNLQMTAQAGDVQSRRGSGVLRITEGKIYKLPVVLGLLQVIYLTLPGQAAFTDADVTYSLQGRELLFEEIYLTGSALSLVGSGRMDLETEALNLNFLAGPPGRLPRIGSIDTLFHGILREIAEIRVTGTLAKPRTRTVSLRSLDAAIRKLLNPGQAH